MSDDIRKQENIILDYEEVINNPFREYLKLYNNLKNNFLFYF